MRTDYTFYEDRYVKVGMLRVRYWDVGQGDKTLVFLHGFGGSVEAWGVTIHRLEKNTDASSWIRLRAGIAETDTPL